MPKIVKPLTDREILSLPKGKKRSDGRVQGLFVEVKEDKRILFWLKFKKDGKPTQRVLGEFGVMTLEEARNKAMAALGAIASNQDPTAVINPSKHLHSIIESEHNKLEKTKFKTILEDFLFDRKDSWSEKTYKLSKERMYKNISPFFDNKSVNDITGPDCKDVLKVIYNRNATDLASRVYYVLRDFFRFCIFKGYTSSNPMDSFKAKDLGKIEKGNFAAITDPKEFSKLLKSVNEEVTSFTTRNALRLSAHIFIRSTELRLAEWEEIDFDRRMWTIPKSRMKVKTKDHLIPLTDEVIDILNNQKALVGDSKLVFPGTPKTQPISNGTFNITFKRLDIPHTQHGYRASFRTIGREVLKFDETLMELQLAHVPRNKVEAAYNRSVNIDERAEMLKVWSKYVNDLMK